MHNLEKEIARWRQRMAASGIKTPVILDELESHLREETERLAKSGVLNEEEALMVAASRIGQSELLRAEFAKIERPTEARLVKMIGVGCGIFAVLFTLWVVPWLLFRHGLTSSERVLGWGAVVVTLFSVVSWRFSYKFLPIVHSERARMRIGIACVLVSLVSLYVFGLVLANVIVPRVLQENLTSHVNHMGRHILTSNVRNMGRQMIGLRETFPDEYSPVFAIGISVLWALATAAIPGAIAYGLEEAARRRIKEGACV